LLSWPIVPYRSGSRSIEGVVVTFVDVTRLTEIEAHQHELNERIETMIRIVMDMAEAAIAKGPDQDVARDP
jgi:hypothetical protein